MTLGMLHQHAKTNELSTQPKRAGSMRSLRVGNAQRHHAERTFFCIKDLVRCRGTPRQTRRADQVRRRAVIASDAVALPLGGHWTGQSGRSSASSRRPRCAVHDPGATETRLVELFLDAYGQTRERLIFGRDAGAGQMRAPTLREPPLGPLNHSSAGKPSCLCLPCAP